MRSVCATRGGRSLVYFDYSVILCILSAPHEEDARFEGLWLVSGACPERVSRSPALLRCPFRYLSSALLYLGSYISQSCPYLLEEEKEPAHIPPFPLDPRFVASSSAGWG